MGRQTAQFFNRQARSSEAIMAFARLTAAGFQPTPQPFYQMAVFYEEKVLEDASLPSRAAGPATPWTAGMEAVDEAFDGPPDYFEALVYKNLLLRQRGAGLLLSSLAAAS